MAKFKFKLEQVLRYREQLENQAQMAFMRACMELEAQVRRLNELRASLAKEENLPYKSPEEFWLRSNFIRSLKEDIGAAELNRQRLELAVERRRAELVKAGQERQLLDKLKDKQAERYAQEQLLQEQKELDEVASLRHEAEAV
ncbi:MAG: flagellar export protein FliJ [Desulfovibrionaceae bacterium]|nr:flagellar export protein FliJ [Desulfovibrionaceae bacterium]